MLTLNLEIQNYMYFSVDRSQWRYVMMKLNRVFALRSVKITGTLFASNYRNRLL
jgi:hypothetical protein